ncbi:hypothetical protein ACKWTF_016117 [Chironomus riparius]
MELSSASSSATYSIQKLAFHDKVKFSTATFNANKFDNLCDLLKIEDFPFPEDFSSSSFNHDRLKNIVDERKKFREAIKSDDKEEIVRFSEANPDLKIAYNLDNKSALYQAFILKKTKSYLQLKSLLFQTSEDEKIDDNLLPITLKSKEQATEQNINRALPHSKSSLLKIIEKSKIHNTNINEITRIEYQATFEKFYEEINDAKYGQLLIDVVSSCEKLKIFFDFESESTENLNLRDTKGTAGSTYHEKGEIFIGAKLTSNGIDRKEIIRGYLAHELCHYAMHLVYENSMKPFYENSKLKDDFEEIVKEFNHKLKDDVTSEYDDECEKIISNIYNLYEQKLFALELIVRVIQIYAFYKDNKVKLNYLRDKKYQSLFKFFENHVVPDLRIFYKNCSKYYDVRKLNEKSGLLKYIKSIKFESANKKPIVMIEKNKIFVVTTNQPKLFLLNAYKHWHPIGHTFFDTQNIVISPSIMDDDGKFTIYKEILEKYSNLNILIDCTNKNVTKIRRLIFNRSKHRFLFIVLKKNISDAFCLNYKVSSVSLNEHEFTKNGQQLMQQTKVDFNGNFVCSIYDLLQKNFNIEASKTNKPNEEVKEILEDIPEIINDQLLYSLMERSEISILKSCEEIDPSKNNHEQFTSAVKQEKCVLLSQVTDSKKMWMIKKIINQEENATRWTSYIETQQIINKLEPPDDDLEFSSLMTRKVLNHKSSLNEEMFTNFEKNGKILFLFDGLSSLAPKDATFLTKVNYTWNDLQQKHQIELIKAKIMFQNYSCSFYVLLKENSTTTEKKSIKQKKDNDILEEFSKIIDDRLLYFLLEPINISIATTLESEIEEENFDFLFQERELIGYKKENDRIKYSYNKLLPAIENEKYVLIADMAGSGKSWMMKTLANVLRKAYPKRWVTYVDLKQYIKVFNKKNKILDFASFMTEKILEAKDKFKEKMFTQFYKTNKIFVLFDGFDEIAPNYAEFVSELAKKFESNGGNQLWIATRDYFEIDLQKELELDVTYKLDDFKEADGINLIASKWVIKDFENKKFNKYAIENHKNFPKYQKIAQNLISKISMMSSRQIGLPQLFSVLADGFDNDNDSVQEFSHYSIFEKASDNYLLNFINDKGKVRQEIFCESQDERLNLKRLHEVLAILSYYPDKIAFFGLDNEKKKSIDDKINAYGLVKKNSEYYYFLHETFREFFAARFIVISSSLKAIEEIHYELFLDFLTIQRFTIIRSFLNAGLFEKSVFKLNHIEEISKLLKGSENISYIFEDCHEYLEDLIISVLEKIDYDKRKNILFANIKEILETAKSYSNFQTFFLKSIKDEDLKPFVKNERLLHKVIQSNFEFEVFEILVYNIEDRFGKEFAKILIQPIEAREQWNDSIFCSLITSQVPSLEKIKKFLAFLKRFITIAEIDEMLHKIPSLGVLKNSNVLNKKEKLEIVLSAIKDFFYSENVPDKFTEFVVNTPVCILGIIEKFEKIQPDDFFWGLLLETFESPEGVKNFVMSDLLKDSDDIITFRFGRMILNSVEFFRSFFSETQFREILKIENRVRTNILKISARHSESIEIYNSIWEFFKNEFGAEFYELIQAVNSIKADARNIFWFTSYRKDFDSFSFIIDKFEKDPIMSEKEIKNLLLQIDLTKQSFLYKAFEWATGTQEENEEFFKRIWEKIQIYFNSSEILEILQNNDIYGHNIILHACNSNTTTCRNSLKTIWNIILNFIKNEFKGELIDEETEENIAKCKALIETITQFEYEYILRKFKKDKNSDIKILDLSWVKTKNMLILNSSLDIFQEEVKKQNLFKNGSDLKALAFCEKLEIHKISWECCFEKLKDLEHLKNFLLQNSIYGDNFFHNLFYFNKSKEIVKFTLEKIQKKFEKSQIQDILSSKNIKNEKLLLSKFDVWICQELLIMLDPSFENKEDIIDIYPNLLLNAAESSSEYFKLIFKKIRLSLIHFDLENTSKLEDLILQTKSFTIKETILHKAVQSRDKNLLETVWKLIENYFKSRNSHESFKELVFKKTFHYEVPKDKIDCNILHFAAKYDQIDFHKILWKLLFNTFYDNLEELKNLIVEKSGPNNFINCLLVYNKIEIIKQFLDENLEYFKDCQIRAILAANEDHPLLKTAASSKDIKKLKLLWKTFKKYFKTLPERISFLKMIGNGGFNLVLESARCNAEIFNYVWEIVDELNDNSEEFRIKITEIIETIPNNERNIIHICIENEDKELLRVVWIKLESFYKSSNSVASFRKLILWRQPISLPITNNILHYASKLSNFDFHEMIWNLIFGCFEDLSQVQSLIVEANDVHHVSYVKRIVFQQNIELIEKILNVFIEKFDNQQMRSIFLHQCLEYGISLLIYSIQFYNIEILKKLLDFWKNLSKNNEEYLELFKTVNFEGNNILHTVIYNFMTPLYLENENMKTQIDIFDFFVEEIKKVSPEEVRKLMKASNNKHKNILQHAVRHSTEIELHECLWKNIENFIQDPSEISKLIDPADGDLSNVLANVVSHNDLNIVEFTWAKIEKYLGVECHQYLKRGLKNIEFTKGNISRNKIGWTKELMKKYKIEL